MDLSKKNCIPCSGGIPPLPLDEIQKLKKELHKSWKLTHDNTRLLREFKFDDFKKAMDFSVLVGEMAEKEWHHPEIHLGYGHADIEIWTHKINGLVESDFIFASKVDKIFEGQ